MALTLRLDQSELDALEKIKQLEGISTASGAIKKLIVNYEQMLADYQKSKLENKKLEQELKKFHKVVKDYIEAKHNLTDMIYADEWNKELIYRADKIDAGKSTSHTLEEFKSKTEGYLNEIKN